jgi:hypothetical protein
MDLREQVIIGYIQNCQEIYSKGHYLYKEYLTKMERIDLSRFDEQDVEIVLKPFLYKWGRMGRVLGGEKYKGWETDIVEPIRSNSNKLDGLRAVSFHPTSFTNLREDIIKFYESLKAIVDRVAATKTMHIICPNFFPLWDNDIARAVRSELSKFLAGTDNTELAGMIVEKIDEFSGRDYYRFMLCAQDFIERYKTTFLNLAETHGKSVVKILDDFFWMIARRPLSLFL